MHCHDESLAFPGPVALNIISSASKLSFCIIRNKPGQILKYPSILGTFYIKHIYLLTPVM